MKPLCFAALILSLLFANANARAPYKFNLINDKDIPVLGEKTKREAGLAKSLNRIIERKNANASALEYKPNEEIVNRYNDTLIKCKESKDESAYYECMKQNKINEWYIEMMLEALLEDRQRDIIDPFPTAKTSQVCKRILDEKPFLKDFKDRISYRDDNKTSKAKRLIFTVYEGTGHFPYLYHAQIPIDANESAFRSNINQSGAYEYGQIAPIYFRAWSSERVRLFSLDDTIYLNLISRDENSYHILSFDKESYFFDQACKIERKTTGYKNTDKICKRVIDGKYNKIAPVNLASALDKNDIERFKSDLNPTDNKIRINKYASIYFYDDGNHSYFIDYANEGKKHILLNIQYSSGAGEGCGYNFLAVYNPQTGDEIHS
ncbi:MAG: hypothetical protein LBC09_04335, partial [Helicobacteraceae bacterium]|nr:hypothetical protein [Helicobacteraceae bacterium]